MGGKIRTVDSHHLASGFSYTLVKLLGANILTSFLQGDAAFDSVCDNNPGIAARTF